MMFSRSSRLLKLRDSYRFLLLSPQMSRKFFWRQNIEYHGLISSLLRMTLFFRAGILQSTNARGVDVVVNTLSGDLFFETWKCVAEGGSMIDLSKWDSTSHDQLDCGLLDGNRSFYSFDVVTLLQQKPLVAQRSVKDNLPTCLQ